jgi:hypothetical protein
VNRAAIASLSQSRIWELDEHPEARAACVSACICVNECTRHQSMWDTSYDNSSGSGSRNTKIKVHSVVSIREKLNDVPITIARRRSFRF